MLRVPRAACLVPFRVPVSTALWLALACVLAAPPAARAQVESREGITLQNQILELRQELDALRQQGPRGAGGGSASALGAAQPTPLTLSPAPGTLDAQLLDRVQRLEEAVRDLRGQIDDANNTRQQQYDELNKKIDDLAFRLGAGPAAGAAAAAGMTAAGTPAATEAPGTPPAGAGVGRSRGRGRRHSRRGLGGARVARRTRGAGRAAGRVLG